MGVRNYLFWSHPYDDVCSLTIWTEQWHLQVQLSCTVKHSWDIEQNTNVINDVIGEVSMDHLTDIKSDIQTLSSIVSDGGQIVYCT